MTNTFRFRVKMYKAYLQRRIRLYKEDAYKVRLTKPTARDIGENARASALGVSFTNVARDIRLLTEPGAKYDPEFDLLWRGQVVPEVVANYSEKFMANIIKTVLTPHDMDERLMGLRRRRADGRPYYEDL